MFVETSAIVAMLLQEPAAPTLAERINNASNRITSPLVVLEASMVLSSILAIEPDESERRVRDFLFRSGTAIAPIDDAAASLAVAAFARYGKGRGHPARLNMSDCLSYACAKQHQAELLYVGSDFAQTDLA